MRIFHSTLALAMALALGFGHSAAAQEKKDEPKKEEVKKDAAPEQPIEIKDQLTEGDPRDKVLTDSAAKIHTLQLRAGKTYQIDLMKKNSNQVLDPYLRIEDSAGKQLAADDDSGGNLNSRIIFAPTKDDSYRLIATCLFGTGEYVLKVAQIVAPPKEKAVDLGKVLDIVKGSLTIDSNLAANDPQDVRRPGRFAKIFQVNLKAGKSYTIDMVSNQIDSYLRLEDSNKNQLAEDDDGGGFPNARIVYRPAANGVFRIIGTSFDPNAAGAFTITVREE